MALQASDHYLFSKDRAQNLHVGTPGAFIGKASKLPIAVEEGECPPRIEDLREHVVKSPPEVDRLVVNGGSRKPQEPFAWDGADIFPVPVDSDRSLGLAVLQCCALISDNQIPRLCSQVLHVAPQDVVVHDLDVSLRPPLPLGYADRPVIVEPLVEDVRPLLLDRGRAKDESGLNRLRIHDSNGLDSFA